jgi:tRNA threonylcarbamoyladenosine biosynthesis protein TsaB
MLLALDLSTPHGHIALVQSDSVLFERRFTSHRSHNSMLYAPLAEALAIAGDGLKGIVIGTGPGSYTGVRISIAAAQGVALSRGVPMIGLLSMASLSDAASYHVIGDARRGHWYVGELREHRLVGDFAILDEAAAREWLEQHDGQQVFTSDEAAPLGSDRVQIAQPNAVRLAQQAALLSVTEFQATAQQDIEPHYLQPAFITQPKRPLTK